MTDVWTEHDLDDALAHLGAALDAGPAATADLATLRRRIVGAAVVAVDAAAAGTVDGAAGGASAGDAARPVAGDAGRPVAGDDEDVLVLGVPRVPAPRRRRTRARVLAAAVVAAAFVAGGAVAVTVWPGPGRGPAADRPAGVGPSSTPTGGGSSVPPDPTLTAALGQLPDPVPTGATAVLRREQGRGDGTITVDLGTDPAGTSIVYAVSCGVPDVGGSGTLRLSTVSEGTRVDVLTVTCAELGGAASAATVASTVPVTRVGRPVLTVETSPLDLVWKATVTAATGR